MFEGADGMLTEIGMSPEAGERAGATPPAAERAAFNVRNISDIKALFEAYFSVAGKPAQDAVSDVSEVVRFLGRIYTPSEKVSTEAETTVSNTSKLPIRRANRSIKDSFAKTFVDMIDTLTIDNLGKYIAVNRRNNLKQLKSDGLNLLLAMVWVVNKRLDPENKPQKNDGQELQKFVAALLSGSSDEGSDNALSQTEPIAPQAARWLLSTRPTKVVVES